MGIVLKVTPEVLQRMAGDIDTQIRDIQSQFDVIDTEINRTKSYWEGDASDTHKNQYDSMKDEIRQAVERLKNNPVNLLQMAGLYIQTESNLTAASQALSADVIV